MRRTDVRGRARAEERESRGGGRAVAETRFESDVGRPEEARAGGGECASDATSPRGSRAFLPRRNKAGGDDFIPRAAPAGAAAREVSPTAAGARDRARAPPPQFPPRASTPTARAPNPASTHPAPCRTATPIAKSARTRPSATYGLPVAFCLCSRPSRFAPSSSVIPRHQPPRVAASPRRVADDVPSRPALRRLRLRTQPAVVDKYKVAAEIANSASPRVPGPRARRQDPAPRR